MTDPSRRRHTQSAAWPPVHTASGCSWPLKVCCHGDESHQCLTTDHLAWWFLPCSKREREQFLVCTKAPKGQKSDRQVTGHVPVCWAAWPDGCNDDGTGLVPVFMGSTCKHAVTSPCLFWFILNTQTELASPLMTKPKLLPSLWSVTSMFLNITPDPCTAATHQNINNTSTLQPAECSWVYTSSAGRTYRQAAARTRPPRRPVHPRSSADWWSHRVWTWPGWCRWQTWYSRPRSAGHSWANSQNISFNFTWSNLNEFV